MGNIPRVYTVWVSLYLIFHILVLLNVLYQYMAIVIGHLVILEFGPLVRLDIAYFDSTK